MTVAPGADVTRWLVQQNCARRKGVDQSSVDPDIIIRENLSGEGSANGPVEGDTSLEDVLLAGATRPESGRRQETVEAHSGLSRPASRAGGIPGRGSCRMIRRGDLASGLVLGRPMTRCPGLKWPRFLSNSTRSKRFRTLRFAAIVLLPLRLGCWLMEVGLCGFGCFLAIEIDPG